MNTVFSFYLVGLVHSLFIPANQLKLPQTFTMAKIRKYLSHFSKPFLFLAATFIFQTIFMNANISKPIFPQGKIGFCIALISILIITGCSPDISKETAAVQARSKAVTAAEEAMNIPEIMKYWDKDAIVQPAGMPQIQGTEAIIKLYHQIFEDTAKRLKQFTSSSINSSNITVARSGDIAYDYGTNRFVFAGAKGNMLQMGKYLIVWKKIDGEWYVSAISFTSDSDAPVPVASSN